MKASDATLSEGHFQMPLAPEGEPPTDVWLRPMPPEEFEEMIRAALVSLQGTEGEEMASLRAWFVRRYPTPTARLAYVRRRYEEMQTEQTREPVRHTQK